MLKTIRDTLTSALAYLSSSVFPPLPPPPRTVYISHQGDDKQTMAIPLRNKLRRAGYHAFVDELDITRGADAVTTMYERMEAAHVFVFVLSRSFLVSEWPVKELLFAIDRWRGESRSGNSPIIIPLFYSISPRELGSDVPGLYAELIGNLRSESPVPGERDYIEAVKAIRRIMGVVNHYEADNQTVTMAQKRRDALLNELCTHIFKAGSSPDVDPNLRNDPVHSSLDSAQSSPDSAAG